MLADSLPNALEWSKCTGKRPAYWCRLRWKKFLINSDTQPVIFVCVCESVYVQVRLQQRKQRNSSVCARAHLADSSPPLYPATSSHLLAHFATYFSLRNWDARLVRHICAAAPSFPEILPTPGRRRRVNPPEQRGIQM